MRVLLLCAIIAHSASAEFVRLQAGNVAKASEVNGNFELLATRIDSLVKALGTKDDSLKVLGARVDSAKLGVESFTKGAVAGFLVAPDGEGYLPGSNKTWLLAGGQGETNGVKVPDLRGVFLRGMELDKNIANTPTAYSLRDSSMRKLGEYQSDAFQGHWHAVTSTANSALWRANGTGTGGGFTAGNSVVDENSFKRNFIEDPVKDLKNGVSRTASETRPKNMAVYWYVKVK